MPTLISVIALGQDGNQVANVPLLKLKKATVASPAMMPTSAPVRLANGTCGNANTSAQNSLSRERVSDGNDLYLLPARTLE